MHCRWYDKDPTVSLAISLIKNANESVQADCADFLISSASERGVTINNSLAELIHFQLVRWYDEDKHLQEAMEYLRNSDEILQREIALELIEFIQKKEFN